jgi:hypothetical protein
VTLLGRRNFLRALGLGTGVAIVAPELLVPEEPRKRIWQVGAQLTSAAWQPGVWNAMAGADVYMHADLARAEAYASYSTYDADGNLQIITREQAGRLFPEIRLYSDPEPIAMSDRWREAIAQTNKGLRELRERIGELGPQQVAWSKPDDPGCTGNLERSALYVQRVDVERKTIVIGSERPLDALRSELDAVRGDIVRNMASFGSWDLSVKDEGGA